MIKKGKIKYLPKIAMIELEDIKREDQVWKDSEAFKNMVEYARVGRELKRLKNLKYDWKKKAKLPPIRKKKNKRFGEWPLEI